MGEDGRVAPDAWSRNVVEACLMIVACFDFVGNGDCARNALHLLQDACLRDPQVWGSMVSMRATKIVIVLERLIYEMGLMDGKAATRGRWTTERAERRDFVRAIISCLMAAITGSESKSINFADSDCCAVSSWITRGEWIYFGIAPAPAPAPAPAVCDLRSSIPFEYPFL